MVYNRPAHTVQTLGALAVNALAAESDLFIYADGPKKGASQEDLDKIAEVRSIIATTRGFKNVIVKQSDKNQGLASSVVAAVTELVNQFGKIIVLEDDIVVSSGFLQYMNDALDFYEKEERVMHISGYMFPVKNKLPPTFFYNTASCWGWGTWARAWKLFDNDAVALSDKLKKSGRAFQFDIDGTYPFSQQLQKNASGEICTWAVRWYASIFFAGGLCLHPYPSLTNNIGFDHSGVHCKEDTRFYCDQLADKLRVKEIALRPSTAAWKAMKIFNQNDNCSPASKILSKIRRRIAGISKMRSI